jgi:large subunit ribosomal protein L25
MAEVLKVEPRETRGKRNARRMRQKGQLPGILYGHHQEAVSLTMSVAELSRALRHGSKLVELRGAVNESAIIRELQWDTFGQDVLHVDLVRVDADERLTVEVPLETRGVAPGTKENGVVELLLHAIEIETTARAIPEKLHLNINEVQVGDTLTAADIEDLPAGAKVLVDPETPLLHCVEAVVEVEGEAEEGGAEPEVIGREAEEEGEGE